MSIRRLEFDEADAIRRLKGDLEPAFAGRRTAEEVGAAVDRAHRTFDGAPVREFVPLLVEGIVRRELMASGNDAPR